MKTVNNKANCAISPVALLAISQLSNLRQFFQFSKKEDFQINIWIKEHSLSANLSSAFSCQYYVYALRKIIV